MVVRLHITSCEKTQHKRFKSEKEINVAIALQPRFFFGQSCKVVGFLVACKLVVTKDQIIHHLENEVYVTESMLDYLQLEKCYSIAENKTTRTELASF